MEHWQSEAIFVRKIKQHQMNDGSQSDETAPDAFIRTWGFSEEDITDLDKEIALFILPRISYFIAKTDSVPNELLKTDTLGNKQNEAEAFQEWKQILQTICDGLHLYISKSNTDFSKEEQTLWKTAKKYLFEYFEHLWI